MNDLAKRAGVGVASLYRYFPNQAAVYAEVARRLQADLVLQIRQLLARPSLSLQDAVHGFCRLAVELPGVDPKLRVVLNTVVPQSWTTAASEGMLNALLDEACAWLGGRTSLSGTALRERVFVAIAAGRGLVMMSRMHPDLAPDDGELVERMTQMAMTTLK